MNAMSPHTIIHHKDRIEAFRSQLSEIFYDLLKKSLLFPDRRHLVERYHQGLSLIKNYESLLVDQVLPLFFDRFDRYVKTFDGDIEKARIDIQGIAREYKIVCKERARREIEILFSGSFFPRVAKRETKQYQDASDQYLEEYFEHMITIIHFALNDLGEVLHSFGETTVATTLAIEKIMQGSVIRTPRL